MDSKLQTAISTMRGHLEERMRISTVKDSFVRGLLLGLDELHKLTPEETKWKAVPTVMRPLEVSTFLQVSPGTLRTWTEQGELPVHVTPGGHRRYYHSDVASFAAGKGIK